MYILIKEKKIFIALFILWIILSLLFIDSNFLGSWILKKWIFQNNELSWVTIVSSWMTTNTWSAIKETANNSLSENPYIPHANDNKKIENWINSYFLKQIDKEITHWTFESALTMYERGILLSKDKKLFTGINLISEIEYERILILKNKVDKNLEDLAEVTKNIEEETSSIKKSELFITKWLLEKEIWACFTYLAKTRNKYEATSYYYNLRAVKSFDSSIKLKDNYLAHKMKWIVASSLNRTDIWINELKKSISINDTDTESYFHLWNWYVNTYQHNLAISTYLSGLLLNKNDELMKLGLETAYYFNNNTLSGYVILTDLLSNCKEYCNMVYFQIAQMEISWGFMDNGHSEEVLSFLNRAIEAWNKKWENFRNARDLRWDMLYKLWRKEEALKDYIWAIHSMYDPPLSAHEQNKNSNERDTYYKIAKTYYEIWETWYARWYLQEALKDFFPGDKKLKNYLQEIEKKVKKKK